MTDSGTHPGKLMKVNLRVNDMEQARKTLNSVLGATVISDRGSDTIGDFDGAMFQVGDLILDVMAPNDPNGNLAKNIERRGEGIDSLCFDVDSVDRVQTELRSKGVELINVREFHGHKIGFVHPRDCCGVLIEFIEKAKTNE